LAKTRWPPSVCIQKLFGLTTSRTANERGWSREALIRISAAVDIACWDIVGKAAGLPLYRLFGGYRDEVPAYVTCGYYREGKDLAELRDEMHMLVDQGHTGFKAKAGGLPVPEDVERMAVMREVIGDQCDFMCRPQPRLGPAHRHRCGATAGVPQPALAGRTHPLGG